MTFLDEALNLKAETIARRRDFHRHPELAFDEVRTSQIVADELTKLGLEVQTGVGKTGVVGLLRGAKERPVLLMRFDMDALPIQEETGADYASVNPGRMHACGHDCHTAVGLSVAKILAAHRETLSGTIKFVFQPAEEMGGGAQAMIADGVLINPAPDFSLGMHVWNDMPVGWYGLTPGPSMSGAEIFTIKLTGKGGHGASPQSTRDPIFGAAQVITALQSIVSRNINPLETAVVSVCEIHGGTAFNIIPSEVVLNGTIRTFKSEVTDTVRERFYKIVNSIAEAMGCKAEIELIKVTIPVVNDPSIVALMTQVAKEVDPNAIIKPDHQTMGSEDFSFMLDAAPGCFMMVGSANPEKGLNYSHHHPKFDVDESCLPYAVAVMAKGAMKILEMKDSD